MLLCAMTIKKIDKMKKAIAKYGLKDMRENVEEFERLLQHIEDGKN